MSYRFVKITDFYPAFLAGTYEDAPSLSTRPYEEQLHHLVSDGFGWADFFSRHLITLGVDAHEIIMNAEPLQRAWAQEHGVSQAATLTEILWRQLETLNPEVLFFENPMAVSWEFLRRCREKLSNLRYLVGWCACPFSKKSLYIYSLFDLMLTSGIHFVQEFSEKGLPVRLMRHGFETSLLEEVPWGETTKADDIVFLGSFFAGKGFHEERWRFFKTLLMRGANAVLHTDLPRERLLELVEPRLLTAFCRSRGIGETARIPDYVVLADFLEAEGQRQAAQVCRQIKKPVFGKKMFAALARARIGIHVHPDISGKYTGGMRPFEVTGMGTCLLTDWKDDLPQIFSIDQEAVAFRSVDEAYAHIDRLLGDPGMRQTITRAGQERTLTTHSYRQRSGELAAHIDDLFAGRIGLGKKFFLPPSALLFSESKEQLAGKTPWLHSFLKGVKQRWTRR